MRRPGAELFALAPGRRPRCGGLPGRAHCREPEPPAGQRRAGTAGAVPSAQHGTGRHRRAGGDAQAAAQGPPDAPAMARRRRGPAALAALLVQPRLPAPRAHRLAHLRDRARKADPVRGGARDPWMARAAPAPRIRPPLLRLFPSAAARRADHLHRGGAGARHERARAAAARRRLAGGDGLERRLRHVLLDHQLPGGIARHLVRQPAHQAGRRGPEARVPAPAPLRVAVGAEGEERLALLSRLEDPAWHLGEVPEALQSLLLRLCAYYLLNAKQGLEPLDAVARFHLGNGAALERLNWMGDCSEQGMSRSAGLMVNYEYWLAEVERYDERYFRE